MPYQYKFTDAAKYPYVEGSFYLGTDEKTGAHIGIKSERHAITIAGAGSGKGASNIIPNLLRWKSSALTIDPKGEAAERTAKEREKMGIPSFVVDPFRSANVDEKYLATYNPLDEIDIKSITIKEDITAISDGIIMRADSSASHWDDGAQVILSGLIAFVISRADQDKKHLIEVREILTNDEALAQAAEEMQNMSECAGLCRAAYTMITAKEGMYFISNARKNTDWLDSEGMKSVLKTSSFSLSELKAAKASVYLVLPANYLGQHGRFLRLFVRTALEKMAAKLPNGELKGSQCLFFLDEFFSLGYIDEIAKAAGLMRGYGLQIWPILQDLGQLISLYGREGAETFFGNADAHIFFGNTDGQSLDYLSNRIGQVTPHEVPKPPQRQDYKMSGFEKFFREGDKPYGATIKEQERLAKHQTNQENYMRDYQNEISVVGRPRITPDQAREIVMKGDNDPVARSMIVFAKGNDVLKVQLAPYFLKPKEQSTRTKSKARQETTSETDNMETTKMVIFWTLALIFLLGWIYIMPTLLPDMNDIGLLASFPLAFATAVITWRKLELNVLLDKWR